MDEEESEFSFKDMFFYCLKKWFVIAVAAVLGVGIGLGVSALRSNKEESYWVSAQFCSLAVFKENNPQQSGSETVFPNPNYSELYSSATSDFQRIMTDSDRIARFVESDLFKTNAAVAFPDENIDTPKGRQVLFGRYFDVISGGTGVNIGVKGEFDTDEKRDAAKNIIRGYAEFAKQEVYESNGSYAHYKDASGEEVGAITISSPLYFISANDLEKGGGLLKASLTGLIAGIVAGVLAVVVIYMIDGRVKSPSVLPVGGELLAKVKEDELKRDAVLRIAGKTKDDKMLLVASPEYDGFTEALSKALAHEFAAAGLKTLYVDFSSGSDGGEISEFYAGKAAADVVSKSDGYDSIGSKNRQNVTVLMSKKEKFASLKNEYDKIVVAYTDVGDGAAVALGGVSDKVLYVINQKATKLKKLKNLATDVDNPVAEIGAYIHNSI